MPACSIARAIVREALALIGCRRGKAEVRALVMAPMMPSSSSRPGRPRRKTRLRVLASSRSGGRTAERKIAASTHGGLHRALGDGLLAAEERRETLRLAVGEAQRVIDGGAAAVGVPGPAVGIALNRTGTAFDLDEDEALGREHEDVDLVDPALVVNQLEVRPRAPRLVLRQMLAQELERFALPLERGLRDRRPSRRFHGHTDWSAPSSWCCTHSY
jgi:hypothetical protein